MSSFITTARYDHFISSSKDEQILLHLREVSPTQTTVEPRAVLCVHGAVLSSIIFDIPVKGASWLDYFAKNNLHAFAIDLRGYGKSTKPNVMDAHEQDAPSVCTHYDALSDIADAVNYIRSKFLVDQVTIVGLSWGSLLAGNFTHKYPHLISHLVLIGPVYSYQNPIWAPVIDPNDPTKRHPAIGGYRVISKEAMQTMWNLEIPFEDKSLWRNPNVWNTIEDEMLSGDRIWATTNNVKAIRCPSGVVDDVVAMYNGHIFYPAEEILVPTLILRGDHDTSSHPHDMENLFKRLGTEIKQYIQIGNASHYALAERRAPYMMTMVHGFIQS